MTYDLSLYIDAFTAQSKQYEKTLLNACKDFSPEGKEYLQDHTLACRMAIIAFMGDLADGKTLSPEESAVFKKKPDPLALIKDLTSQDRLDAIRQEPPFVTLLKNMKNNLDLAIPDIVNTTAIAIQLFDVKAIFTTYKTLLQNISKNQLAWQKELELNSLKAALESSMGKSLAEAGFMTQEEMRKRELERLEHIQSFPFRLKRLETGIEILKKMEKQETLSLKESIAIRLLAAEGQLKDNRQLKEYPYDKSGNFFKTLIDILQDNINEIEKVSSSFSQEERQILSLDVYIDSTQVCIGIFNEMSDGKEISVAQHDFLCASKYFSSFEEITHYSAVKKEKENANSCKQQ